MSDTIALDVANNIVSVLAGIKDGSGALLFGQVLTCESVDAFTRVADPIPGVIAGLLFPIVKRGNGKVLGEAYAEQMDFSVMLKLNVSRNLGTDDKEALEAMTRVVAFAREALAVDVTRGGRCGAAHVAGKFLRPTDLSGQPRIVSPKKGHSFYVAMWPVTCGRSVAS